MKVAVLFSGGKDSTLALYHALKKGMDVKYLVSIYPKSEESYMFHFPNVKLTKLHSKILGIPLITKATKGEKEVELNDLKYVLKQIKSEIDAVTAGALASKYQYERIEKICKELGLKIITPLWRNEPEKYWENILNSGFEVIIVSVSCEGLGKEWLGRKIDNESLKELKKLSEKFKFHLAFEGGEAETFVIDAPFFRKKIKIIEAETVWNKDSGFYFVKKTELVGKNKPEDLVNFYCFKKNEIKKRLQDFKKIWKQTDEKLFAELCFCLCTPQSNAVICDTAISTLEKNRLLFSGDNETIEKCLKGVRFRKNKAKYIVSARDFFSKQGKIKIKEKIELRNPKEIRDWLVNNVKGLGYKEASHFLRNIGIGEELAILDRHILKNLRTFKNIETIPKTITKNKYLEIENKMKQFSNRLKIPLAELDLLLWSMETGKIFK